MRKYKSTAICSILHFFVDGICALAMYGWFASQNSPWHFLAYNFCAFALQMPFGAFLDMTILKRKHIIVPYIVAALGVLLTVLGAILHPILLGIGNALFHVGGGVGVIYEDHANQWSGKALGIFVAPGALGLFLGTQIAKEGMLPTNSISFVLVSILTIVFLFALMYKCPKSEFQPRKEEINAENGAILAVGCFLVVILRSYIGFAVTFSWKNGFLLGLICVLAVVLGKMAGGILAARFGMQKVMTVSLVIAAVGYLFSENHISGILALFVFNMSMPVTLYLLVCKFRELPGFSFGLLTFGLFLGYLPVYWGIQIPISGNVLGAGGSLLSLLILVLAMKLGGAIDVDRNR